MSQLDAFLKYAEQRLVERSDNGNKSVTEVAEPAASWETKALDDLDKWRRFALKRWERNQHRPFESEPLRGDIADALTHALTVATDKAAAEAAFDAAIEAVEFKAIQATRLDFENAFAEVLREARNGNLSRRRWASLVRSQIKRYGMAAFRDGLQDGGVDPEEMTDDDRQTVNELISDQSRYVTQFGAVLFDSKAISDAEAQQKPAMWYNRSIHPFYQQGELSADQNGMREWVLGRTEEHCSTCSAANTQRHRLKSWHARGILPKNNGFADLECGGFNCECRLVPIRGRARGRLDRIPTY